MVIETEVRNIAVNELAISDVVKNLKVYSKTKQSLMHPLLRSYISITLPLFEFWTSVYPSYECMTCQEFKQQVMDNVIDVWLVKWQPKFLKQIITSHAELIANKLGNIAFGGM